MAVEDDGKRCGMNALWVVVVVVSWSLNPCRGDAQQGWGGKKVSVKK
jgi:hypothetical protein